MSASLTTPQVVAPDHMDSRGETARLRAVVCGSFRRDLVQLRTDFDELQLRVDILSPVGLNFVDPTDEFVRLPHELRESRTSIEQRHLDALASADFVWLHAPDGYVGSSAMFELGQAKCLGIPVYARHAPADTTFAPWVNVVPAPADIEVRPEAVSPGSGLRALQSYYERAAARRGWGRESPQDTLLLLTEEMGELARAVRKTVGLARDGDWQGQDIGEELADVQLYLVHLANTLNVDIADEVTKKELINAARVAARSDVA